MKKKFVCIIALFLTLVVLSACGQSKTFESADSNDNTTQDTRKTIKVAHSQSESHPVHIALLEMKKNVENASDGKLSIDIYANGVMGDEFEMFDQIMMGTLDASLEMGATVIVNSVDPRNIEELPWLFKDKESARRAWDGELGDYCKTEIIEPASKGKVLAYWESGFRHITNNVRPIYEPSDMEGLKLRLPASEVRREAFTLLGASPIQMAFGELFTGLQQGTVDGQENPLAIISSSKLQEVQKYLSLSGHCYSLAMFLINDQCWNNLTVDEQEILQEAALKGRDTCRQLIDEMESGVLKDLEAKGMLINEINYDSFYEAVQPVWDNFRAKYGDKLVDLAISSAKE